MVEDINKHAPVLFLVFNRPDTTARVFESIRDAKPARLYVAADGPRPDRPGEANRCALVRDIATAVDWPCELLTLMRDNNLGCRVAVSEAITWFFAHEERGIILEDDTLPTRQFFKFCECMLERYKDDDRVGHVGGFCANISPTKPGVGATFSKYPEIWGWATWRRVWEACDLEMLTLERWLLERGLTNISDGEFGFEKTWTGNLKRTVRGEIDTWDYRYIFNIWRMRKLSVLPSTNLVANIGFGADATHTVHSPRRSQWLGIDERVQTIQISFPRERDVRRDMKIGARRYATGFSFFLYHHFIKILGMFRGAIMPIYRR